MDESPKDGMGEGDTAKPGAVGPHLPVVWSPKLDAAEAAASAAAAADEAYDSPTPDKSAMDANGKTAAAAALPPRPLRVPLLAASIALAAGFGSFAGVLAATGVMHLLPDRAPSARAADASGALAAMKAELAELSAMKSALDGATKGANAEFAKIADRLDRVERAEADPAAKLAQIADTVDRLDKRGAAAPETTGSIAPPATTVVKDSDKILPDWIVQDVRRGRAMVENRYGSVYYVEPGTYLPHLGSVETIKRQDGQWVVVTEHGTITSLVH